MTQTLASASNYVMPTVESKGGRLPWFLAIPALAGFAIAWFMGANVDDALMFGVIGFVCGMPFFIIGVIIVSRVQLKAQRAIWETHTFKWYRETFPAHAHDQGHVTCRHCGSHKTNVRNLMQRTFMRVHSCSQCGETLYFSPERV